MGKIDSEYHMNNNNGQNEFFVTPEVKLDFDKNGYIVVRDLFSKEEISKLRHFTETDEDIKKYSYGRDDGSGRIAKLCIWNYPGDDVTGVVARCRKVFGTMQALLGGEEIYHYHSKLMMKEPRTGGSFVWHQDYGYWYQNGCLLPEMGTVWIPLDKCVKENGCLQFLKGSHKMGRVDHILAGDQAGADPERVKYAKDMFPLEYLEMEPGDVLFFHCNLLHSSNVNDSDLRRWAMAVSVNKKLNNPVKEHHCPQYYPCHMLPNSSIMECDNVKSTEDKGYVLKDTPTSWSSNLLQE